MTKQAAAVIGLAIAGAIITALFAYMFVLMKGLMWAFASVILGCCTVTALISATKPDKDPKAASPTSQQK